MHENGDSGKLFHWQQHLLKTRCFSPFAKKTKEMVKKGQLDQHGNIFCLKLIILLFIF